MSIPFFPRSLPPDLICWNRDKFQHFTAISIVFANADNKMEFMQINSDFISNEFDFFFLSLYHSLARAVRMSEANFN